jgi:hypothetical protein
VGVWSAVRKPYGEESRTKGCDWDADISTRL